MEAGMIWSQLPLTATSSTLFSKPWSTMSRNCLEVLNCAAVGALPPTMRLMVVARDWSAPAMALSIHRPPALLYASANCLTACDSPPDVHQWITVAFSGACACAVVDNPAQAARASAMALPSLVALIILSPVGVERPFYSDGCRKFNYLKSRLARKSATSL